MNLPKKVIRRNTVVKHVNGTFYGRVIRVLPDGKIFWLCCGLHFRISNVDDLIVGGYRGYIRRYYNVASNESRERFIPMSSLRRLKKLATRYHGDNAHNTPLDYEYIGRD